MQWIRNNFQMYDYRNFSQTIYIMCDCFCTSCFNKLNKSHWYFCIIKFFSSLMVLLAFVYSMQIYSYIQFGCFGNFTRSMVPERKKLMSFFADFTSFVGILGEEKEYLKIVLCKCASTELSKVTFWLPHLIFLFTFHLSDNRWRNFLWNYVTNIHTYLISIHTFNIANIDKVVVGNWQKKKQFSSFLLILNERFHE